MVVKSKVQSKEYPGCKYVAQSTENNIYIIIIIISKYMYVAVYKHLPAVCSFLLIVLSLMSDSRTNDYFFQPILIEDSVEPIRKD